MNRLGLLGIAAAAGLVACSDNTTDPTAADLTPRLSVGSEPLMALAGGGHASYVILGANNQLPADLAARIVAAGGTLLKEHPGIGVAVATGGAGFADAVRGIQGIESVAEDMGYEMPDPGAVIELDESSLVASDVQENVASTADNDLFYFIQWAPAAVHAPEAWNAGYRGAGVRVAILDGGVYTAHQDLVGKFDVAASKSFACVPAVPVCPAGTLTPFNSDVGTFWHGTHVSGIVAANDNTVGGIGIAPSATLIGVKVLHNGSGFFSWAIDGIMYAAKPVAQGGAGAQVINMSLGALIDKADPENTKADIRELDKAISRATTYAWDHGVTVVAAAGNDAVKLGKRFLNFPSMSAKVIAVAATAPMAWAYDNLNDPIRYPFSHTFWRQASYTNFGKKGVDFAAPGGDFAYPGNELCTVFGPVIGIRTNCWVFDMYLSTSRGSGASVSSYSWAAGTSMATPVVSGVAALIIGKAHGMISPGQVKEKLKKGAIDYGKRGRDDVYGDGWVTAFRSVKGH